MSYDTNNIFAKIINKEIPAEIIYEDDDVIAFNDIAPAAPIHVLVIPKQNYCSFNDFMAQPDTEKIAIFFQKIRMIANDILKINETGYRLITNHGTNASQTVFHFHVHIISGKRLGKLIAD
ncbi:MAG: HIT domain-containing protein [Pseudomonadota bacterium]